MPEYERNYEFKILNNMPLTDCHVHLRNWSDGEKNGLSNYMEPLEKYRTDFKIKNMNMVCIPYCYGRDVTQNIMAAILKLEYPDYYVHGGTVYPSQPVSLPMPEGLSPEEQLDDLMAVGLDGIKMIETKPNYQKMLGVKLSDPLYDKFFAKAEKEQISILCHASDPERSWCLEGLDPKHPEWHYANGTFLTFEEIHEDLENVLDRYPNLKITLAHIFFLENHPEKLVELLEKHPNLTYDICPHTNMFGVMSKNVPLWKEIFTKYSDRIMNGADYCSSSGNIPTIGHDNIYRFLLTDDEFKFWNGMEAHGLGLAKADVEKILYSNFYKAFGEKSKPINKDALKEYINKYEKYILNKENRDAIFNYCEERGLI